MSDDTELTILRIYKEEATEALADNERVILLHRERITELEFHLGKLRGLLWLGYSNTSGILPMEYTPDNKTKVKKAIKKAAKSLGVTQ
jgi:hypothetical protein